MSMKRIAAAAVALLLLFSWAIAETGYVICKPDSRVYVRRRPDKSSEVVGFLEAGDSFETEWKKNSGYIRVTGIGEYGTGWIFTGFVSTEEPQTINERYVCEARKWVACRRWKNGPRVKGKAGWLHSGSNVMVYFMADGWAVTSRGYIRAEWLGVDPE